MRVLSSQLLALGLAGPCFGAELKIEPYPMRSEKPATSIRPFSYEAQDGLLLRNGKPHLWIGSGDDLGSINSTPVGLWLARLQGSTIASTPHGATKLLFTEDSEGTIHLNREVSASCYSWLREAIRLGFLGQAPEGGFRVESYPTLVTTLDKHPELREVLYDVGHALGADPAYELGRKVVAAKREPLFTPLAQMGFFMPELNREPGPDPYNRRVREGFVAWAQRKYGTLETANAVWKTSFPAWTNVVLRHVAEGQPPADVYAHGPRVAQNILMGEYRNLRARLRTIERNTQPELYWDWLRYTMDDTMAFTATQIEDVRKMAPGTLVGSDIRGHHETCDRYVAYNPMVMDTMADLMLVHNQNSACDYRNKPYSDDALQDVICWPLFTSRFFQRNTTKPIVNVENIVQKTLGATPTREAMAKNDLAGFAEAKWYVQVRPADKGNLYRTKFRVSPRLQADYLDGTRKYYLVGYGKGYFTNIHLNGRYMPGTGKAFFKIDISDKIKYYTENEIVVVIGSQTKDVKPEVYVLAGDLLVEQSHYGEKQEISQYWSDLMSGLSGDIVWYWTGLDHRRPYRAAIAKRIEAAAEIVLPNIRHYRSRVGFLYSYLGWAGVPMDVENRHRSLMNWCGALEFTGRRPDILGEEAFCRDAMRYETIVAPMAWCVEDETLAVAHRYVEQGGCLVVTKGSLGKTFSRYADSGFSAFAAAHPDRVTVLPANLPMAELAKRLDPFLPKPELDVTIAPSAEFPCIERMLVGDETRKVLYLQNWGGLRHEVTVRLPECCRDWRIVTLDGSIKRMDAGLVAQVEGSQGVTACILAAPGAKVPATEITPAHQTAIKKMMALNEFPKTPSRRRVLFPIEDPTSSVETGKAWVKRFMAYGVQLYPHHVEAVRALGYEVDAVSPWKWTPELLAQYDAVFIFESTSQSFWIPLNGDAKGKAAFQKMITDYAQAGGSVFLQTYTGWTAGAIGVSILSLGPEWLGVKLRIRDYPYDPKSCGFDDPRQAIVSPVAESPLAQGVDKVQLSCISSFGRTSKGKQWLKPAVAIVPQSDRLVMATGEMCKGRFFISGDALAFQPFRIECANNAELLLNAVGWLLRQEVTNEMRKDFRKNLFVTTELLKEIETP